MAHNFSAPLEAFLYWEKEAPNNIYLQQPFDGSLKEYSYKKVGVEARKIAQYLKDLNLPPKSHIALISKNCAHWIMADLAIMMSGHISIPIYPTLNAESIRQILEHSESKAIIVGKLDFYEKQRAGIPDIPIIGIEAYGVQEDLSWEQLVKKIDELSNLARHTSEDLHTIIYTSGTTGTPKGVMHTVRNVMTSINTLKNILILPSTPRFFSFLPLAHVAERQIMTYGLTLGACIRFPESLATFAADLEATQPHAFFAVPRIWTKFQEKIVDTIGRKRLKLLLKIPFLNKLIKSKLQEKLGLKHANIILSAAAPLAKEVIDWYTKLDIEILQVYGMTEDCCISHFNMPNANKVGTVGKALPGVDIKFSEEGEILIKNKCLMKGYYKAPEMTAEVMDKDGFFHTGDLGEYDHDGFLSIIGRAKDQFKTDKGKYISPAPIELLLEDEPVIEQVCVVGTGIPQPIGLVVISEVGSRMNKSELIKALEDAIQKVNPGFEKHEYLEKLVVMKEQWTVDNGLLTPTLKVRRNRIEKIHQEYYKSWFKESDKIVFEV
ncbi:AMP-binding protein [Urechidicola sp. KH5]